MWHGPVCVVVHRTFESFLYVKCKCVCGNYERGAAYSECCCGLLCVCVRLRAEGVFVLPSEIIPIILQFSQNKITEKRERENIDVTSHLPTFLSSAHTHTHTIIKINEDII